MAASRIQTWSPVYPGCNAKKAALDWTPTSETVRSHREASACTVPETMGLGAGRVLPAKQQTGLRRG